jgi:hypothetical protein
MPSMVAMREENDEGCKGAMREQTTPVAKDKIFFFCLSHNPTRNGEGFFKRGRPEKTTLS